MNPVDSLKAVLCGQDGKCCIAGSEADRKVVDEAIAALDTAQPEPVNEWKDAVIDALVVAHILTPENAIYPRKAVQDVIDWNCQVALDPRVSSKAQALVDSGKSVQVNAMLVEALGKLLPMARRHGTLFGSSNPWTDACDLGDAAITAAQQAQPERAPTTAYGKGSDQVWFAQNYGPAPQAQPEQLAPAPGYCKTCKDYTIEEPLQAQPERAPLSDEQDRALCDAYYDTASDEYFKVRPQLESDLNRRIFYAGHRYAWINYETAHGIKQGGQQREQQPVCHGCGIPAGDVHMSTCKSGKWPSRVSNGDTAAPAPQPVQGGQQ